jgi:hypothetical protein
MKPRSLGRNGEHSPVYEDPKLVWLPIYVMTTGRDAPGNLLLSIVLCLPSGISNPNEVLASIHDGPTSQLLKIQVAMPEAMTNSIGIHSHILERGLPKAQKLQHIRVANYNSALEDIQPVVGKTIWFTATINLPQKLAGKQFFSEHFKEGKHGAKILCLDMLVEHARTNVTKRSFAKMEDESIYSLSDEDDDADE